MFSSLAGLEFEWSLLSDADKSGAVDAYNILRFVMKKCHSFVKDDVIISLSTLFFYKYRVRVISILALLSSIF